MVYEFTHSELQFFSANDPVWALNTLIDEQIWIMEKGIPRLLRRILTGEEFEVDLDILTGETESFQHLGRDTRKTKSFFEIRDGELELFLDNPNK